MCDTIENARKVLLDFFRTQINLQIQTITGLIIALFSQGVATSFIPDDALRLPVFLFGVGFFGGLAFTQWAKMFWYGRLWNATLIARSVNFKDAFKDKELNYRNFDETDIAKLYLGVTYLFLDSWFKDEKQISRFEVEKQKLYAMLIYLGLKTTIEIVFCLPIAFILSTLFVYYPSYPIINLIFFAFPSNQAFIFITAVIALTVFIIYVRCNRCCSSIQIKNWLSVTDHDLKKLVS